MITIQIIKHIDGTLSARRPPNPKDPIWCLGTGTLVEFTQKEWSKVKNIQLKAIKLQEKLYNLYFNHMETAQWAYAYTEDTEDWRGPCATREDAIAEALDMFGGEDKEDGYVYISKCRPVKDTDEDIQDDWTFVVTGGVEKISATQ